MADDYNLYPLRVFLLIVRTGSVTLAARELSVSQPAVSAHLRALEERYGGALFDRTPRGMRMTPAGKALAEHAERLFALLADISPSVAGAAAEIRGAVIVAASSTPGSYLAPPLLRDFRSRYPQVEPVLLVGDTAEALESVRDYRADLALVGEAAMDAGVERVEIGQDELRLATAADDMLCRVKPIRREYLSDRTLLLREPGSSTRAGAERLLGDDIGAFRRVAEIGSSEAIKQAVIAGLGAAVLSSWSTRLEEAAGLLRPVRDDRYRQPRRFYLVRRADRPMAGACLALWEFLVAGVRREA